jgi:iduronate 2-sulfatase
MKLITTVITSVALSVLAASAAKPNVLMILVDDLKPALGCYGDEAAVTPNLDAFAKTALRFDKAYCNTAVCAASRFNLMLATRSSTSGLYAFGKPLRDPYPDAITLPQYFIKHGYRAESLGKVYHIGHGNTGDPKSWSVPHFKDFVIEYALEESTGGELSREEAMFRNAWGNRPIKSFPRGAAWEAPEVEDDAYADGRVATETIKRLQAAAENPGQPFFIACGFARPHLPFVAPKKYWDLHDPAKLPMPEHEEYPDGAPEYALKKGGEIKNYKPVPEDGMFKDKELIRKLIYGYYASTSYMDAQFGKVMDELSRLGLDENTIVVIWGDHGFHLGDHGFWTKHTNYEQATRIPVIIRAPGVTKPGSATRQIIETVDLFPTLVDLAGLPAPDVQQLIDGESHVPVLKDPAARVSDHAYLCYRKGERVGRTIRTERYRLVEWKVPGEHADTAVLEFYDYEEDPLETENISAKRPEEVKALRAILNRYPEAADARVGF